MGTPPTMFEGEKWRRGEDLDKVLNVIDNVLKAAKNMLFLCSREVLDHKGYHIGHIPCLFSGEVITVFLYVMSEQAIDELRSYPVPMTASNITFRCLSHSSSSKQILCI
eukprot:g24541.t1